MEQLVFIKDGMTVTDSLTVAEVFGKRHADVIRSIERLECSDEFTERNFALSDYKDPTGRSLPKYIITQDGFSFLVMGYTGKEAARFKEMYIAEFNRMREQLAFMSAPSYMIDDPIQRAQRWIAERQERDAIESQRLLLEETVVEQAERLTYLDEILQSQDAVCVTQIAADYGLTAPALNSILKEEGVQYRVNDQWILKGGYKGMGYVKSQTIPIKLRDGRRKTKMHTRWTQSGRLLIHEILTERGIEANRDRTLSA